RTILKAELLGFAATAVSLGILLRPLGIMGAAIASVIGYSVVTMALGVSLRRHDLSLDATFRPRGGDWRYVIDVAAAGRHPGARLRPGADLFSGWSSQCRASIAAARRLGMTTIVERGSAHIEWQWNELTEEARLTGLFVDVPHARTIEQELAEYEAADFIAVP